MGVVVGPLTKARAVAKLRGMFRLRRLTIPALAVLGALLAPAAAHADASSDPSGFRLASSTLTVNENAGQAVITIERTDTSEDAQIRYITLGWGVPCGSGECTAVNQTDFTSVKGMLDFPVGVANESFTVPIVDHGVSSVPKTIQVSLFGPSPIGMASPSKAVLTIVNDDPAAARGSARTRSALGARAGNGNPLSRRDVLRRSPERRGPGGAAVSRDRHDRAGAPARSASAASATGPTGCRTSRPR